MQKRKLQFLTTDCFYKQHNIIAIYIIYLKKIDNLLGKLRYQNLKVKKFNIQTKDIVILFIYVVNIKQKECVLKNSNYI